MGLLADVGTSAHYVEKKFTLHLYFKSGYGIVQKVIPCETEKAMLKSAEEFYELIGKEIVGV